MLMLLNSFIVGVSLAIIPGPIFFELTKRTLRAGWRSGFLLIVGDWAANLLLFTAAYFGNSLLLQQAEASVSFQFPLLIIGGLLLVFLGISGMRVSTDDPVTESAALSTNKSAFLVGGLMALSSPLTIIALLGVGTTIIHNYDGSLVAYLHLVMTSLGILCSYLVYLTFLNHQRKSIPPTIVVGLAKLAGLALFGFGAWFFLQALTLI